MGATSETFLTPCGLWMSVHTDSTETISFPHEWLCQKLFYFFQATRNVLSQSGVELFVRLGKGLGCQNSPQTFSVLVSYHLPEAHKSPCRDCTASTGPRPSLGSTNVTVLAVPPDHPVPQGRKPYSSKPVGC